MDLQKLFKNFGFKSDKRVSVAIFVLGIGFMLLIFGNMMIDKGKPTITNKDQSATAHNENRAEEINAQLEKILSQIKGVGQVSVMVNLSGGREVITATDIKKGETVTEEKDSGGGARKTTQTDTEQKVVLTAALTAPVVVKELEPTVTGAIVVAEGAENPEVQERLKEATKTVLGISIYKVQVFPKNAKQPSN